MKYSEIIKEIEETSLFDFIAGHGWKLDKDMIRDLFREFNFEVYLANEDIEKKATEGLIRYMKEQIEEQIEE